jgi:hypothetical protein
MNDATYALIQLWKSLAILVIAGCAMNTSNAENNFRFENYKTADELTRALYELHPGNSPVDALLETLKKAGATCSPPKVISTDKEFVRGSGRKGVSEIFCSYRYLPTPMSAKTWTVGINFDNGRMILSISSTFYLT